MLEAGSDHLPGILYILGMYDRLHWCKEMSRTCLKLRQGCRHLLWDIWCIASTTGSLVMQRKLLPPHIPCTVLLRVPGHRSPQDTPCRSDHLQLRRCLQHTAHSWFHQARGQDRSLCRFLMSGCGRQHRWLAGHFRSCRCCLHIQYRLLWSSRKPAHTLHDEG